MDGSGRRLAVSVVLAVVHPGLGHVYLRRWVRALLWAGLFLIAVATLLPAPPADAGPVEATRAVATAASPAASLAVSSVVVVNAVDVGLLAVADGGTGSEASGGTCPDCGKELDEDLEFCHWCTTRIGRE